MDINLEKTLRQRQADNECIICGVEVSDGKTPAIALNHYVLGNVLVCESHIKQSGIAFALMKNLRSRVAQR